MEICLGDWAARTSRCLLLSWMAFGFWDFGEGQGWETRNPLSAVKASAPSTATPHVKTSTLRHVREPTGCGWGGGGLSRTTILELGRVLLTVGRTRPRIPVLFLASWLYEAPKPEDWKESPGPETFGYRVGGSEEAKQQVPKPQTLFLNPSKTMREHPPPAGCASAFEAFEGFCFGFRLLLQVEEFYCRGCESR